MLQSLSEFISKVTRGEKIRIGDTEAQWRKVSELTSGLMIAVTNNDQFSKSKFQSNSNDVNFNENCKIENSEDVLWDEIVSIRRLAAEQVYDIEVEGTHNFVAGHYIDTRTEGALSLREETLLTHFLTRGALLFWKLEQKMNKQEKNNQGQPDGNVDLCDETCEVNHSVSRYASILTEVTKHTIAKKISAVKMIGVATTVNANKASPDEVFVRNAEDVLRNEERVMVAGIQTTIGEVIELVKKYQSGHVIYSGIFAHNTVGKALLTLNETGDQNILTASASGSTQATIGRTGTVTAARFADLADTTYYLDPASTGTSLNIDGNIVSNGAFSISSNGNNVMTLNTGSSYTEVIGGSTKSLCVTLNTSAAGSCDGKVDAGTIDPPYTINGKKYATYVPSMVGIKEETTGTVKTTLSAISYQPSAVIDFRNQEEGSDLWLFSKVTALKKHMGKMTVLLSPAGNTRSWYEVDPEALRLTIFSSRPTTVSYRLSAPRFDADQWQNTRGDDDSLGHVIEDPDLPPVAMDEQGYLEGVSLTLASQDHLLGSYELRDSLGNIIEEFLSASQATIANLTAGTVKTSILSPLSGEPGSGIAVTLGPSQTFGIYTKEGTPAATFDNAGNATISGTLYADRIVTRFGEIEHLQTSTVSAEILDLIARVRDELNAKQEAPTIDATSSALLTLLAQDVATLKSETRDDLLIDSTILIDRTGINTITDTLHIQPAKLGNLDIMGGTILVNTIGDVVINGNLAVSGNLSVEGVLGVSVISPVGDDLIVKLASRSAEATTSGSFGLLIQNPAGITVTSFDASGNATVSGRLETAELLTKKLSLIADRTATESSNAASFGESILPIGQTQVSITSTGVTQDSLIFITPTSATDKTLYVVDKKKEEFTVGTSAPSELPIRFNWWIIN